MKKILLSTTAAFLLTTSAVSAQSNYVDQVVRALQAEDYDSIEVKTGPTQFKVEAIRNGMKLEVVYDLLTGAILEQEIERADSDDDDRRGVSYDTEDNDFVGRSDDDDDNDDDDDDDDRGDNDDRDDDDDSDDNDDDDDDDDDDNDDDNDDDDDNDEDD
jgi:hypothetical protein